MSTTCGPLDLVERVPPHLQASGFSVLTLNTPLPPSHKTLHFTYLECQMLYLLTEAELVVVMLRNAVPSSPEVRIGRIHAHWPSQHAAAELRRDPERGGPDATADAELADADGDLLLACSV